MRGGISMVSKRHAKANNPYLADYNPNKETNYLMYYDANNLYGCAMSQPLPYSGFKWITPNKNGKYDKRKEGRGRIFEVDLEYSKHLHKLHNDYPLAPKKTICKRRVLLPYQTELLESNKSMLGCPKLAPNLRTKK